MAKRNEQDADLQVIAAVVLADLAQLEADAETHPDADTRQRMLSTVARLRSIAEGTYDPESEG